MRVTVILDLDPDDEERSEPFDALVDDLTAELDNLVVESPRARLYRVDSIVARRSTSTERREADKVRHPSTTGARL